MHLTNHASNDLFVNLGNFFCNLGESSWRTALITLLVMVIVALSKREWRGRKLPREFPLQFSILLAAVIISWGAGLPAYKDIPMVGAMPTGFPAPAAPDMSVFGGTVSAMGGVTAAFAPGLVIATITYAQSIGVSITYAREAGESVDCDQEMVAMGAASVVSAFFGGFAQSASLSRSATTAKMGGSTPLANAWSACCAIITLLFAGPAFRFVARCCKARSCCETVANSGSCRKLRSRF